MPKGAFWHPGTWMKSNLTSYIRFIAIDASTLWIAVQIYYSAMHTELKWNKLWCSHPSLANCETTCSANPVFNGLNQSPAHKDKEIGSFIHLEGNRTDLVRFNTFLLGFHIWNMVLPGPWGHFTAYVCTWRFPTHAKATKGGCSDMIAWHYCGKYGTDGCCLVEISQIDHILWLEWPSSETISRPNPVFNDSN